MMTEIVTDYNEAKRHKSVTLPRTNQIVRLIERGRAYTIHQPLNLIFTPGGIPFSISDADYPKLKIKITTLTMIITINVKFVLTICHKTVDSLETVLGQSQVNRARVPGVLDSVNYQPTGLNRPVSSTPNVMFI